MESIRALSDLLKNGVAQSLIIVTTNGFAKNIWETANANKIKLLTFSELQHSILKLYKYLDRLIENFDSDELSRYYVNSLANDQEGESENAILVEKYLNTWLTNPKSNHLSVLGEYGTGKTCLCRKLAHDLAMRYKQNPLTNRIPILINLRDYSKVMTVRQLITDLLINEYGLRGIDYPLFERMNEDGLLLLIFDGFDEMAQKVLFDDAYSNFSKIAELAGPQKSKVILTCRTEFFRTHAKEKEILVDIDKRTNFSMIYLKHFTDSQIKEFLKKRAPMVEKGKKKRKGWLYYYQKIQQIFDLRDLAKRPVLLELIVKYLPQLIEKDVSISASTLYLTTIEEELNRRLRIGKTVIQRTDRIKLMKLLAMWMYNNDHLSVFYEDIPDLLNLKQNFELKTATEIEYHLSDFLTCSFLSRDVSGNYQFSHKSFVDFLVANYFVDDIAKDNQSNFRVKPVTFEVIQFIKNFNVNVNRLYDWILYTKGKSFQEVTYIGGNSVSLLNALGEQFKDKSIDFSNSILNNANFSGQDLSELKFRGALLINANLNNTTLRNTDFSRANLAGAAFGETNHIQALEWSPDGRYVACMGDSSIKIWRAGTWEYMAELENHVPLLSFSWGPIPPMVIGQSANQLSLWEDFTLDKLCINVPTQGNGRNITRLKYFAYLKARKYVPNQEEKFDPSLYRHSSAIYLPRKIGTFPLKWNRDNVLILRDYALHLDKINERKVESTLCKINYDANQEC